MKVKELVSQLRKVNPELEVVLTIHDGDGNITSWELQTVDLGWEPSDVISLESNECIMC